MNWDEWSMVTPAQLLHVNQPVDNGEAHVKTSIQALPTQDKVELVKAGRTSTED